MGAYVLENHWIDARASIWGIYLGATWMLPFVWDEIGVVVHG